MPGVRDLPADPLRVPGPVRGRGAGWAGGAIPPAALVPAAGVRGDRRGDRAAPQTTAVRSRGAEHRLPACAPRAARPVGDDPPGTGPPRDGGPAATEATKDGVAAVRVAAPERRLADRRDQLGTGRRNNRVDMDVLDEHSRAGQLSAPELHPRSASPRAVGLLVQRALGHRTLPGRGRGPMRSEAVQAPRRPGGPGRQKRNTAGCHAWPSPTT